MTRPNHSSRARRLKRDAKVVMLRTAGTPIRAIAKSLRMPRGTVFSVCEKYGLVGPEYDARLAVNRR